MRSLSVLASIALLCSSIGASELTELPDWNQWRGPERDGSVSGADWPSSLAGLEPLWTVELGKGYPGALVTNDTVFVVETIDKKSVAVRALRRADGTEVWTTPWAARGDVPFFAAANGAWVRSTPAWDGETLYVGDMEERIMALDGATGEVRWTVDFPERFGTKVPDFGFASSPLVDADALYVQAANSIVKIDRASGKTLWRSLAGSDKIQASGAFSSPVIETIAGIRQLVVLTRHTLHGVALDDGRELWSQGVPNFRGMNILTPVFDGDRIFTSSYKNGSFLFKPSLDDGTWTVSEEWKNPSSGYMSSPVVVDGFVYLHLGNGRVSCMNLKDGEEQWRSESFGKYWSMIRQGDKLLALDERGELVLLRANPERFELLDRREVATNEAWGYLAIHGDNLFVRDLKSIRGYRWSPSTASAPSPQEKVVFSGEYEWNNGGSDELTAEFTPRGAGKWDIEFSFRFSGKRNTWSGSAVGDLSDGGEVTGTATWKQPGRRWVFNGTMEDGELSGSHAEVRGDEESTSGTFRLAPSSD